MKIPALRRKPYWGYVGIWLCLKIGIAVTLTLAPNSLHLVTHLDTPITIGLAVVVGARFADIGWPRWLGVSLVVLITMIFPVLLMILRPTGTRHPEDPYSLLPDLAWISGVALLALLIVTGLKRSSSDVNTGAAGPIG